MALGIRAARARSRLRTSSARAVFAVGAVALAVTVAACGNGSSSGSGSASGAGAKDGFTQAAQTSGPLTVWVDSTRVPAAQAYQKAHPNVKLNIVTYDGDANGSNTLQTKVSLYDRTGSGWPDVVFSAENNEVELGSARRVHRAAEQGPDPGFGAEQVLLRGAGPVHGGRHGVLPA